MSAERRQRRRASPARSRRPAPAPAETHVRALQEKYRELWSKHRQLIRRTAELATDRSGAVSLGLFTLRAADVAVALVNPEQVLVRNGRWQVLERDRTRWRATAREPDAPAERPTLLHLATDAARVLLRRSAPASATGRYERPERGDVFDVRFERIESNDTVGVVVRDVTRLVTAERDLGRLRGVAPRRGLRDSAPDRAADQRNRRADPDDGSR